MKPFFSYFGSKARIAKNYGAPRHELVVEPFAGSASYSVYWEPKYVCLIDSNPVIIDLWQWLIRAVPNDVLALPLEFNSTDDLDLPLGAKHLIGFWLNKAASHPSKKPGAWAKKYRADGQCRVWSESVKARLASQVNKIKHWEARVGNYDISDNVVAHWFVDPPYTKMGHRYQHNAISRERLASWCRERRGFSQVCEDETATWLPFKPFRQVRGLIKQRSFEAVCELHGDIL